MLNATDKAIFEQQTRYPQNFVVSQELYDAISLRNRSLSDMQQYRLQQQIASEAGSLDDAYQMYIKTEVTPPAKKASDFSNRRELNNYLRKHGYRWDKVDLDDGQGGFGECGYRWELSRPDLSAVTVEQALEEIQKGN